ncbi:MAG: hypothetical protein H6557_24540 [Lewinellaceae bacterium]|nr:hypothetical protein [Phaeodactylibacter sp.]MCB9039800.1 hypothetical protein [Lewinellaceae bacterium]
MRKSNFYLPGLLAAAFIIMGITACQKEQLLIETGHEHPELNGIDLEIINYLIAMGVDPDEIEMAEHYCIAEGDIAIDKVALLSFLNSNPQEIAPPQNSLVHERQYGVSSGTMAVSAAKVAAIKFYVHPTVNNCQNPTAWISAITTGTQNWTNISNCRVKFTQVYSSGSADLIISSDEASNTFLPSSLINLPSSVLARTKFPAPTLGTVCKFISIRKGGNPTNRVNAIMHELGHALGYFHTNGSDGTLIHGTPTTDNSSVMYQITSSNTTFTNGDLRAARLFYPDIILMPGGFNALPDGVRRVKIVISSPPTSYPIYWLNYEIWNSTGYTRLSSGDIKCNSTTFFLEGISPGTYKFRVRGQNYKKDVQSDFTSFKTVTVP